MKKLLSLSIFLLLFLMLSCSPAETPAPTPEQPEEEAQQEEVQQEATEVVAATNTPEPEAPAATPTPAEPFPPVVVQTSPQVGEEVPLDGAVELTFDQPMDRDSVEKAFAIQPGASADGTFEWLDDQTVRFIPNEGFQRGQRYRVRVVDSAQSQAGLNLGDEFELTFSAAGGLEVSQVQPAPDTTEVLPESQVLVFFNRPVVPLTDIGTAGSLPDPLTFTPPVTGQGEWVNTATYQFTPDEGFEPATEYTARVAQGLADVTGQAVLEDDFEWTFSTVSPGVVASLPAANDLYVSPTPVISVAFNQQMDHESVEQNLLVINEATGEQVPGQFEWADEGIVLPPQMDEFGGYPPAPDPFSEPERVGEETVSFTPSEPLTLGTQYQLLLPRGVTSQAGTESREDYSTIFTVIPPLEVINSNPPNGEQFADIWQGLDITFSGPINPSSVVFGETLLVEPDVSRSDVYTYTSNNDTVLSITFPRRENQVYTVTLTTDITDRYGQPPGQDTTLTWKTLRQTPYVRLVSPEVAIYNGYQEETYIYMTVRNVSQVNFELYRLNQDDFIDLAQNSFRGWDSFQWEQFDPATTDLVGQWTQTTDPAVYENYVYKVDVSQAVANGNPLPPGLYYLEAYATEENFYPEARQGETNQFHDRQVLIVTRNNITVKRGNGDALAWVTDLQSAQPVANIPLTFIGPGNQRESGTSNGEGVGAFTYTVSSDDPNQTVMVLSGSPEQPESFGVGSSGWNAGIAPYEFSHLMAGVAYEYNREWYGHIYSERPLYRPGQTVYFKGILRHSDDARYSVPDLETITVNIYDAQYRQVFSEELPLNEFGTVNGAFPLAEEASLGAYQVELSYPGPTSPMWISSNSFTVAEYRKPEFLVEVTTDKEEYLQGETINLSAEAEFFFGGPVQNANVRWTLLSDPYFFEYEGEGFYSFTNEDDIRSNNFNPNYSLGFGEQIASGTGVTDEQGRFTLEVPADLTGRLTSQTFTFDVAVTGLNNQQVAGRAQAIVHKGLFYVGLRPAQYVGQVEAENEVEVIVVDWPQGQPVANQEVELVVAEQNWYSVQQLDPEASQTNPDDQFYWENLVEDVAVFTTTVTTDAQGQAIASFTPETGGSYKVYARAVDSQGNEVFSSTFLWVSGYEYVNWGQENNDRIELVADKTLYNTGETATILVPHPYSGTVKALVTVERAHIYDHFVTELETNSSQISIPITEEMMPNAYISVMIVAGGEVPSFKLGYTRLNLNTAERTLNIALTPSPPPNNMDYYQPGDTVEYQVKVTDFQGEPVQAELSLALIDKAILTLMPEREGQLLEAFWKQRILEVETGASMTLALDRINQALDERKGGGGGDGAAGPDSVRQNFADTAFWLPDLVTDGNGEGTVEVTLPDNLTTWVMVGKAVTKDETLVGETRVEIVASKPLLVRPVTPRFLVVGDELQMGQIVQNNSQVELEVEAEFEAEGLEIGQWRIGEGDWAEAGQSPEVTLAPGEEVRVDYQVTAQEAEVARLTMGAKASEFSDGVALEIPIYHPSTPETVGTAGVMIEDGVRLESIALPQSYDPSRGELNIKVEPSLAAGMQAGLTYLQHFPYECVEQTVSRFLPNIFTYRAYQDLGMNDPDLAEALSRQVNIGVQRLMTQQNTDGGWGWWPGEQSNSFISAYVVLGLVEANRSDFTVETWVIDNATNYLNQTLVAPRDIEANWQANQQAFTLYVLAEAGQSDLSRSVALFEQREQLDMYGRAFLAMAIALADPQADQIATLVNDLTSGAITSATGAHWEETEVDYRAMNTDVRSTAIIITALSRLQPDHPLLPQAVRWLMTVREQGGYWPTTQETSWSLIGLTDWLVVSGELEGNYEWRVALNGQPIGEGEVNETNLDQVTEFRVAISELLADTINRLTIERDSAGGEGDSGRLYYGAYLTYYKPVAEVKALNRGISVSRQYSLLENGDEAITEAKVGDLIQVRLTLVAPTDLHYIIVEDYLPAGAEAINSSLATTSVVGGQAPEFNRAGADEDEPWGWWYFTHTDLRDEKAALFADYLPKGVYEYTYTIRASLPGEYQIIPTHAAQMYFPDVFGRSDGGVFRINP